MAKTKAKDTIKLGKSRKKETKKAELKQDKNAAKAKKTWGKPGISEGFIGTLEKVNYEKIINIIFMILIASFMIIVPFYRGLFFRTNYIPAIIYLSIVFTFYILYSLFIQKYYPRRSEESFISKDSGSLVKPRDGISNTFFINTYLDIAFLAIPFAYLLSFFFAANAKDAFDMLLIYSSYFMLYKITDSLIKSNIKYKDIFLNIILLSIFLLSFTAILTIGGTLDLNGVIAGKRLYGLYQYPNTSASVLGAGIILAVNMLINTDNLKLKSIYQAVLTGLISTFIFTLSRGGYLVLAGVLVLNFLLIKARAKLKFLLSFFISFLSASMLIYKYYTLAKEELKILVNQYFISLFISAIIIYLIFSLKDKIKINISNKNINIALVSLLTVVIITFGALFTIKEPIEYLVEHKAEEEGAWKNKKINFDDVEPESNYTLEFDVKSSIEDKNSYRVMIRSYNKDKEHTELLKHTEPVGSDFTAKSLDFTTLEDTERVVLYLYNYYAGSQTVYKDISLKDSTGLTVQKMDKLKYIPETIAKRLEDINLETSGTTTRIRFARDGLKIFKDYIITGAGGGAWENLYRQYQSAPYNTTETHNFYVQYAAEVGIIGLIALGGVLLSLVIGMLKSIKDKSNYLYIYLAAMSLLLHSLIDFNLSLAAVGYLLWMLIGILNSHDGIKPVDKSYLKYAKPIILILTVIIVIFSTSMFYGTRLGAEAAKNAKDNKDIDKAIEFYERAAKYDRFNADYRFDLAQIMNNQLRKTKDKKYYDGFFHQLDMIKKYEPYNHKYTPTVCSMLLAIGKLEEASQLTDERIKHQPMVIQSYTLKMDVNYQIAKYLLENERIEESIAYLEKVLGAKKELDELNEIIEKPMKLKGDYSKMLEATQNTLDMIKEDLQ